MDNFHIEKLIVKHLSGESTTQENDYLEKWFAATESNRKLFHFHKVLWKETGLKYKNIDKDRVYNKILSNIQAPTMVPKPIAVWNRFRIPVYVRAASVMLFLIIGVIIWHLFEMNHESKKEIASRIVEKRVVKGQKLKTCLPDGSVVWLNAESKISYDEYFTDSLRKVQLEGMAYFEVAKDTIRPFVVTSRDVDIVALGTAFSVRSYNSEDLVSVALEEGNVLVRLGGENHYVDRIILDPGKGIYYNVKDQTYTEAYVKANNAFNWREGVLYFENASFDKIVKELTRWYGVEFEVLNSTEEQWKYTATFRNFSLKEVLQSMSYTKDFNYQIHSDKITIYHKN